ncbi:uncharacterized protein LOC101776486 isoform X2 [Setaria italica]|uniref:uncharacterized protein LOC101776486 isoform X2 n=1 Tax=Setaria italica TaxID=4555 RepID=UPI000BE54E81|nr:uncharacterized protein LOC101776486 isoform X2 [Setaria italica]
MVKAAAAFARILNDINDANNREVMVQEVDAALQQLQSANTADGHKTVGPEHGSGGELILDGNLETNSDNIQAALILFRGHRFWTPAQAGKRPWAPTPSKAASSPATTSCFTKPHQLLQELFREDQGPTDHNHESSKDRITSRHPRRIFDMSMPVGAALQEFLAMFQGPLPQDIIAASTAAFNLEDLAAQELDAAMAAIAGEAIEDIQAETLQLENSQAPETGTPQTAN